MKAIQSAIFAILASASLHAMEDVRIVPFEYEKHGDETLKLFRTIFPKIAYRDIPAPLKKSIMHDLNIDVAINPLSSMPNIIGFIVHESKSGQSSKACDHLLGNSPLRLTTSNNAAYAQLMESYKDQETKIHQIKYLAVDSSSRSKGYGTLLEQQAANKAAEEKCDFMVLQRATDQGKKLYDRLEYVCPTPHKPGLMAKPLNDNARTMLEKISGVEDANAIIEEKKI